MIKSIKRYVNIFRGVSIPWMLLLVTMVLMVVMTHVEVGAVTITASIIDGSQKSINTGELAKYVGYLLLSGVLSVSYSYINGLVNEKIRLGVRLKLWNKLMRLPTKYYDVDNGNELVSRVTTDADASNVYFQMASFAFSSIYGSIVAFQQLFAFNVQLATWMLIIIPIIFFVGIFYCTMTYYTGAMVKNTLAATMGFLSERVRNFRLIRSFGMEEDEHRKGNGLFRKQYRAELLFNLSSAVQSLGIGVIQVLCIVIPFVFGGRMVASGELSTGRLVGFYTLSTLVVMRLAQLYVCFGRILETSGSMQKISQVMDTPEEKIEGAEMTMADADIRLENVSFSYNGEAGLRDLNVTIPKGKVTAIVGPNGAGKSTLFKLLERMYEPAEGRILFGQTDISGLDLPSWRKSIGIVTQDDLLLSGTIRENILYGVERQVSEEELIQVAKLANAWDFIEKLPDGFDTQAGPDGSNFSGGQKQCIAIARAIMRNPDYLLLDEATSNLDAKSEHQVSAALVNLMKGRTTVMIAHSYAATREADHVIVMRDGRIETSGSPQELLRTNSYYQQFAKEEARSLA